MNEWEKLTSDNQILQIVKGDLIEFDDHPLTSHIAYNPKFSSQEEEIIDLEIEKMLKKKIIVPCEREKTEYLSPIFITPKSDGGH